MTTLLQANSQWSSRPADERFGSVADMHKAAMAYRTSAAVAKIKADALRVAADGHNLMLVGEKGRTAQMTNWSFGQVAERAKSPAAYLKTLPAAIAADCLNDGLKRIESKSDAMLLLGQKGGDQLEARAVTSDKYSRIWNADITKRLLELEAQGPWMPAPAAFDGSRGLYLGDRLSRIVRCDNSPTLNPATPFFLSKRACAAPRPAGPSGQMRRSISHTARRPAPAPSA